MMYSSCWFYLTNSLKLKNVQFPWCLLLKECVSKEENSGNELSFFFIFFLEKSDQVYVTLKSRQPCLRG